MAALELLETTDDVVDWGLKAIGVEAAWRETRGEGIRVAVLDSGWPDHPDLPNVVARAGFSGDTDGRDEAGHGTHTAGIIGAIDNGVGVVGVAPGCELICGRVLPITDPAQLADAIDWAVAQGARVINMSLGSPTDYAEIRMAVKRAYNSGVVLVAAAGNSYVAGQDTIAYPARYPEVLAVGAVDASLHKAAFSAAGAALSNSVAMPGVSMLSCWLGGGYARMSGTSCAAPMLSGLIALIIAHANVERACVHQVVQDTLHAIARKVDEFSFTGWGVPDASRL
jgi:subtilisin